MGVLILLIAIDLVIVGVLMYFVMAETPKKHEHYIPNSSQHTPAGAMTDTPVEAQPREWAVQTVADSEAAAQAESDEDAETLPVAEDAPRDE